MIKVFIDGSAGTTGLKVVQRLSSRDDIQLITLPENLRKDPIARKEQLNNADCVFLCLPDVASKEAVAMIENPNVVVIDTSTAHRTNSDWAYGFPELAGYKDKISTSKRIANPGCHASGFIALIWPLVNAGILDKNQLLTCFSLTGYTGGGKSMIADYQADANGVLDAPRQYALGQAHKHLPEIQSVCGLETLPCFCPIVGKFAQGMEVTVPLFSSQLKASIKDIEDCYKSLYTGGVVKFVKDDENGFLSAGTYANTDSMGVSVYGNQDRILLVSRFDNLGKGASGAAIQNMNIALGLDEYKGLKL